MPIRYRAVRFGDDGRILVVGRDLRPMATLQQRLVESQQEMEREYTRIRNAEKRYRLLFQLAAEAVLILDSGAARIIDVNPAAAHLLGAEPRRLIGREFEDLFAESSRQAIRSFLAATRVAPRVDRVHAELAEDHAEVLMTGSLYRQDGAPHLVVLLSRMGEAAAETSPDEANILRLVEVLPEAFVVVGADRRVISANAAFLDLVQATSANQVRGESIERWVGRQSVETDVLFSNLRAHGSVRHFSTVVRGELGTTEDVELVAVSTVGRAAPIFGLTIRAAGWRGGRERLGGRELPRTVEQFTELVGRVPMKNLVRETTDLIERLVYRGGARAHPREPGLGRRDAGPQPAGLLRQIAQIWPRRRRRRRRERRVTPKVRSEATWRSGHARRLRQRANSCADQSRSMARRPLDRRASLAMTAAPAYGLAVAARANPTADLSCIHDRFADRKCPVCLTMLRAQAYP